MQQLGGRACARGLLVVGRAHQRHALCARPAASHARSAWRQTAPCGRSASGLPRPRALPDDVPPIDPLLDACPVPVEQQPLQELKMLREAPCFDWATLDWPQFTLKLAGVYLSFFMFVSLPVSAVTFDMHKETLQLLVASSVGGTFVVTVLVLRLLLGWQYIGERLLSATVAYEETGWYDPQTWVKSPQMLMRDRLTATYTVKPVLARLKRALLGLGGALVASVVVLAATPAPNAISAPRPPSTQLTAQSGASSAVSAQRAPDYDSLVRRFEPWALEEEGEEGEGLHGDLRTHMQGHGM